MVFRRMCLSESIFHPENQTATYMRISVSSRFSPDSTPKRLSVQISKNTEMIYKLYRDSAQLLFPDLRVIPRERSDCVTLGFQCLTKYTKASCPYHTRRPSTLIILALMATSKRILILSATGPTGILTVREALEHNHNITMYARNLSKLAIDFSTSPRIKVHLLSYTNMLIPYRLSRVSSLMPSPSLAPSPVKMLLSPF
jgi:hypothetical protein